MTNEQLNEWAALQTQHPTKLAHEIIRLREATEVMRAKCEAIARKLDSPEREFGRHVACEIADAIAALKDKP